MRIDKLFILSVLSFLLPLSVLADNDAEPRGEKPSDAIIHHILDSHDWHITDWPVTGDDGHVHYKAIGLHLPWMFYSSKDGFVFSGSTEGLEEKGYFAYHEHVYAMTPGANLAEHKDEHGHLHFENDEAWESWKASNVDESVHAYDFSITKTALQMMIVGILLIIVFISVANSYKKRDGQAPKGLQSLLEPIIMFVRDDIVKEYIPKKQAFFTPYLLTLFFFIWFSNLLGLTPFNSNIMGNISVTAALAFFTFILIHVNASKDYWHHMFAMPGVPKGVVPLMTVIEVLSAIIKPSALAIRLFANITAGHFMILSLISLIFILGKGGTSFGGAAGIAPISILFTIAIFALEMIVAIIQAYIFTLLSAVFIGMAMESHDDHH
ncbi:MAG: F0F1 ATP synthase subunit A [Bacteroidota bacterium]